MYQALYNKTHLLKVVFLLRGKEAGWQTVVASHGTLCCFRFKSLHTQLLTSTVFVKLIPL